MEFESLLLSNGESEQSGESMSIFRVLVTFTVGLIIAVAMQIAAPPAEACGGFFCENDPVDQTGERILFTMNGDGTVTTLIEIQYQGSAADFSWILPIPEAIDVDDVAVPEDGELIFDELHNLTDVIIRPPRTPDCAQQAMADDASEEAMEDEGGVEVFASGEVGPFGFDVIGSSDPDALINWLLDNNYRVDPPMEPLIDVYVEEEFAFIAMRLLDGETSESITPIELTYPGDDPMIPLRLTAVAAMPNMPIFTWFFAEDQVVPSNYAHMEIETREITFATFGGNDYTRLMQQRADAFEGQAFITEFAQPTDPARFTHPYLASKAEQRQYLTRLATYISPDEMTVDPMFEVEGGRADVSRIRDASDMVGLFDCERDGGSGFFSGGGSSDAIDPTGGTGEVAAAPIMPEPTTSSWFYAFIALAAVMLAGLVGAVGYRAGSKSPPNSQPKI